MRQKEGRALAVALGIGQLGRFLVQPRQRVRPALRMSIQKPPVEIGYGRPSAAYLLRP